MIGFFGIFPIRSIFYAFCSRQFRARERPVPDFEAENISKFGG